ncbi:MAG: OmpA/MotB family protein [Planctomycetota bacterium]|jgi:chemotaxis protein MotB
MAKKKHNQCPKGVPGWIVTYGDMMSLLLCFFILLAAFSELKKPKEYEEILQAIQEEFGFKGGIGVAPTRDTPITSIQKKIEAVDLFKETFNKVAKSDDPGIAGKSTTVKKIRDGLQFTVGALITFDLGSAHLKDEAHTELRKIAGLLIGYNNKIDIRGHCSHRDLITGSEFRDPRDLSYARAKAVADYLAKQGVRPVRMILHACAANEPLKSRVYDTDGVAVNRRVEVIINEAFVSDYSDERTLEGVKTPQSE